MIRKLSILGVPWDPFGAPFGEHFGVIFMFFGDLVSRGVLGAFWGDSGVDFKTIWEDFGMIC